METFSVRKIRQDELMDLLELYKQFENGDLELEDNAALRTLWDDIYHNPNLHYIVVEEAGKLVFTCNITIIKNLTRNARPYGLIENVVTHSDYRNRGYGKQAIQMAVEIAKLNNCYKVMLLTGSKKEETLNFYRSAGFRDDIKTGFIMKL